MFSANIWVLAACLVLLSLECWLAHFIQEDTMKPQKLASPNSPSERTYVSFFSTLRWSWEKGKWQKRKNERIPCTASNRPLESHGHKVLFLPKYLTMLVKTVESVTSLTDYCQKKTGLSFNIPLPTNCSWREDNRDAQQALESGRCINTAKRWAFDHSWVIDHSLTWE